MSWFQRARRALTSTPAPEPVSRRRFFAGASAAAGGLLLADRAHAESGASLGIEPGTVVDAMGRPVGRSSMSDEGMLAEIRIFAGNFAPRGWAFCAGQLLPISQNTALFSIIGTIYGGDGETTFALPDLRGRAPLHPGTGPGLPSYSLGQKGGTATETLNVTQIPSHNHGVGSVSFPEVVVRGTGTPTVGVTTGGPEDPAETEAPTGTTANVGGGQSHNNMPPFLAINYIIALVGVFPSSN